MANALPFWLECIVDKPIIWYTEGGDTGGDGNTGGANENSSTNENDGGDDSDDTSTQGDEKRDTAALLAALQEERAVRKRLEREKKTREALEADEELKKKDEVTQLSTKLTASEEKLQRLGKMYYKHALDTAIEREARNLNFIDVSDAIAGVDRSVITAEQEPDDPAVVVIDDASLKKAVKGLADKKKHLIRVGTGDGSPTGSSFGGGGGKPTAKMKEDELKKLYPNL